MAGELFGKGQVCIQALKSQEASHNTGGGKKATAVCQFCSISPANAAHEYFFLWEVEENLCAS